MWNTIRRVIGLDKSGPGTARTATNLNVEALRQAAHNFRSDRIRQYYDALPADPELDRRAQELTSTITAAIPDRLARVARENGKRFDIVDLIGYFSGLEPGEHQVHLRAAPLIVAWCKANGLSASIRAVPSSRDREGDHQIEKLAVHVEF
jgi:hypothetical protein